MKHIKREQNFSNYLDDYMPKSIEWMFISDVDYVLYNTKTKRFLMLEIKTLWNEMKPWQREIYWEIHKRLMLTNKQSHMKFVWTYLIEFNWKDWNDDLVYISGTEIKEKTIIYQDTLQHFLYEKLNLV